MPEITISQNKKKPTSLISEIYRNSPTPGPSSNKTLTSQGKENRIIARANMGKTIIARANMSKTKLHNSPDIELPPKLMLSGLLSTPTSAETTTLPSPAGMRRWQEATPGRQLQRQRQRPILPRPATREPPAYSPRSRY